MIGQLTSRGRGSRPAVFAGLAAGLALLLACLLPVVAPAAAAAASEGAKAGTAPAATDPVVAQVLQLLRDGVAEPVILLWLQKSGQRPAAVSSGDLVALHQAGASDDLMKLLLAPAGGTAATAPSAAAPSGTAAHAGPAAGPGGAAATVAADAVGATVKVRFAVTYRPLLPESEDSALERWLLCLYVDGRFVAAVKAEQLPVPLPARTFERELAPGKHLLRITQEHHLRTNRRRGYVSPARVDPSEFPFELQRGAATRITIRFGEKTFKHRGPVAVALDRDGKEVARLEPAVADPETWPALCEDIPAAVPAGAEVPAPARRELESCVHWTALWPGLATVPSRDEVRAEILRLGSPPGGPTD